MPSERYEDGPRHLEKALTQHTGEKQPNLHPRTTTSYPRRCHIRRCAMIVVFGHPVVDVFDRLITLQRGS